MCVCIYNLTIQPVLCWRNVGCQCWSEGRRWLRKLSFGSVFQATKAVEEKEHLLSNLVLPTVRMHSIQLSTEEWSINAALLRRAAAVHQVRVTLYCRSWSINSLNWTLFVLYVHHVDWLPQIQSSQVLYSIPSKKCGCYTWLTKKGIASTCIIDSQSKSTQ